ncbi:MAG: EscR/YscR/HrcR family type III secretion system export apparatus protein [Pseudomonadota bacterium]
MELTSPLIIGFIGSFILVAALTLTAFVKLSVVLMIVRNAIGLPQVPSNMIIMGLALFLAVFISTPVFNASVTALTETDIIAETPQDLIQLWVLGISPFKAFLSQHIDPDHLEFFIEAANETWAGSGLTGSPDNIVIQIPAFMISELTRAFVTGFVLYLPFIAIDLAITGILMALGMQMVQPNIISVPFKLLIFVAVDGWSRLVEGLVLGYGG